MTAVCTMTVKVLCDHRSRAPGPLYFSRTRRTVAWGPTGFSKKILCPGGKWACLCYCYSGSSRQGQYWVYSFGIFIWRSGEHELTALKWQSFWVHTTRKPLAVLTAAATAKKSRSLDLSSAVIAFDAIALDAATRYSINENNNNSINGNNNSIMTSNSDKVESEAIPCRLVKNYHLRSFSKLSTLQSWPTMFFYSFGCPSGQDGPVHESHHCRHRHARQSS